MAKTFQEVNTKRVDQVIEKLDVILKSARVHEVDNEELNDFLMPIVEHMGMKGAVVKTYSALPSDEPPVIPVEEPQHSTNDQVRVSRWVHTIPGHTFKTVVAATMSRLNDGED